ncbi:MAG: T9SS type A sorting domain-containing protein [Saprospiraceae bacterium]
MNKLQQFALLLCFALLHFNLNAQGWVRTFGGSLDDRATSVIQTTDNGFLSVGDLRNPATGEEFNWIKTDENGQLSWTFQRDVNFTNAMINLPDGSTITVGTHSPNQVGRQIFANRLDAQGNEMWFKSYGAEAANNLARSIRASADGNFFLFGRNFNGTSQTGYLAKITPDGTLLWEKMLEVELNYGTVEELANGELIVLGTQIESGISKTVLTKLDASGNEIWLQVYEPPVYPNTSQQPYSNSNPRELLLTNNGYFLLIDIEYFIEPDPSNPFPSPYTDSRDQIMAVDFEGNITWEETYFFSDDIQDILLTSDENVLLTRNSSTLHEDYLRKIDLQGNLIWETTFTNPSLNIGSNNKLVIFERDGFYSLIGHKYSPIQITLWQTDVNGNITKAKSSILFNAYSYAINQKITTTDQGYLLAGYIRPIDDPDNKQFSLIKLDQDGNIYTSTISGNVFVDDNQDCLLDNDETKLEDWMVRAEGTTNFYAHTNSNGDYYMEVDTGSYSLSVIPKNDYWQFCDTAAVEVQDFTDAVVEDFGASAVVDCPFLEVDVSTAFLRRCFPNTYIVRYCNTGTQTADNVKIDVSFDEYLQIDSSSLPIVGQVDNSISFDIGTVPLGTCGRFFVYTTLDCDSTFLGQTHCVEARITPDSFCVLPDPLWNGASIEVAASCQGDSVLFEIKNVGTAAMDESLEYFIVVDDVILRTGNYQLGIDKTKALKEFAGGATLHMDAMQVSGHPGNSQPSVTVEGCASNSQANISIGFVTQFGENDGDPFVSIDCHENIGAFDPNDKQGFPKGYGPDHYIEVNQDLEYFIRFQNTGTDTAFKVVVIDTISPFLDLTGFQTGASSHPYELDISGTGVLTFTFDNIMLPDSNVNLLASNGFIKFKIPQQLDNPIGTEINNSAAIYFDFNKPIITNLTEHIISNDFIPTIEYFDLEGSILTLNQIPIEQVDLQLSGFQQAVIPTTAGGLFQIEALPEGQDYTVRPEKNINLQNGLTTFDLVLMSKHLLTTEQLNHPLLWQAADLDRDGSITVLDLFLLRKVILNLVTELPNNDSWRFFHAIPSQPNAPMWEEEVTIENLSTDTQLDFTGIKVGDLNQSANPNNLWSSEVRNQESPLSFQLKNPVLKKGEQFQMWFRAADFKEILAYQFSLKFDTDALIFNSLTPGELAQLSSDCFGLHLLSEGIITTSWFDLARRAYTNEDQLFALNFTAKRAGRLSDFIQLSQQYTPAIAYDRQETALAIEFVFEEQESVGQFAAEVFPNPTNQTSQLNYQIYQTQEMTIRLYNTLGQVVKTILPSSTQVPGQYQYTVELIDLPRGTYLLELQSSNRKFQQKLVKF